VTVPDVAGALAGLTRAVAEVRANVVEIHHDRAFSHIQLGETDVELVLETRGFDHIQEVGAAIQRAGYHFVAR
jgi:threonine dehydratase